MYPSYKYRPKKRNSGSSTVNLPPSPPSSSPSLQDTDQDTDSLGSLEDLDLLDLADIEDNGMQNIIEEVMTMEDGAENSENVQPSTNTGHRTQPRVLIPKLTQAVLAPKKKTFQDVFQSENPPQAQVTIPLFC